MTRARVLVALLGCSLLLSMARPAQAAANPAAGRAAFDEGQRLFLAGDYRAALAAFKQGYLLTDDAAFTLNIAQCHRYLGETMEALMMYRLFLRSTPERGNREARAVATKAIRELEVEAAAPAPTASASVPLGVTSPAPVETPPTPAPAGPRTAGAYPVFEPSAEVEAQHAASVPSTRPAQVAATAHHLRQAGIACGVAGVVSVGAGIYYWTRASSLSDSANHATTYNQSDYDRGRSAETMQWVFYGVGTAALATGAALYFYGRWYGVAKQPTIALAPVLGPGAAGLAAQGGF